MPTSYANRRTTKVLTLSLYLVCIGTEHQTQLGLAQAQAMPKRRRYGMVWLVLGHLLYVLWLTPVSAPLHNLTQFHPILVTNAT
jgi:hypothetical protein